MEIMGVKGLMRILESWKNRSEFWKSPGKVLEIGTLCEVLGKNASIQSKLLTTACQSWEKESWEKERGSQSHLKFSKI